ncbi:sulfatase-like hydrolase/transferase [Clostridium neonatale]|uniref:sulfatase-like hydrolase/transferase n=2 Tax=Clostridium neonatale TaxID=137838 RepID=UPI001B36A351|nr:sulfatase-like hydrolase/transferase [Clostridium neonatale]MBP8313495.1 sulfatase-like hydrolase/transferase [Clostridium neonatale]CAI3535249.1 putative Arylsulfatase A [Clostridium neonatale]CAI3541535.1 putative Arylsulfatase A [Clostridium neonatale]CAI3575584.1 putative Arylsulfatase A [Clostridium neonatale]CAI3590908.1 putative Arylsulfatase A [Clostridium neonatale]
MVDIDLLLEKILIKYELNLDEQEPTLYEKYVKNNIKIKWNSIDENLRIAIWGAGEHTIELLDLVKNETKNIICIVDKNSQLHGERLNQIKIVSPEMLKEYRIDLIVVSAPTYQNEIINEIVKLQYKYLDIYDIVNECNMPIQPWYAWGNEKFAKTHYYNYCLGLFLVRKLYCKEKNIYVKKEMLLDIIKEYLRVKDFVYAKKYIKIFLYRNYYHKKDLRKFLTELESLLCQIQKKIKNNKNNNFLVIICDGMRYSEFDNIIDKKINAPFISEFCERSVFYTNAIANSTHTRPCIDAMLTGKLVLDDKRYKSKKYVIGLKESNLFCTLIKENYKIYNDTITRIVDDNINIKNIRVEHDIFESSTEQLWRMLKYLFLDNGKKIFYIIHLHETHYSYLCNYHRNSIVMANTSSLYLNKVKIQEAKKQYLECIRYLDKQFEFYFTMLPKEMCKIITSDHGQNFGEHKSYTHTFSWYEETVKTPLIVNHYKLNGFRISELFDKSKFGELIIGLLKHNKVVELAVNEVKIQRDKIYSKSFLENQDLVERIPSKFFRSYKIIRTSNKKHILYDDGKEELYRLPNEDINKI